jgi:hypothetical protein
VKSDVTNILAKLQHRKAGGIGDQTGEFGVLRKQGNYVPQINTECAEDKPAHSVFIGGS